MNKIRNNKPESKKKADERWKSNENRQQAAQACRNEHILIHFYISGVIVIGTKLLSLVLWNIVGVSVTTASKRLLHSRADWGKIRHASTAGERDNHPALCQLQRVRDGAAGDIVSEIEGSRRFRQGLRCCNSFIAADKDDVHVGHQRRASCGARLRDSAPYDRAEHVHSRGYRKSDIMTSCAAAAAADGVVLLRGVAMGHRADADH